MVSCNKCIKTILLLKNQNKGLLKEIKLIKEEKIKVENDYKFKFLNFIKNIIKENKYYKNQLNSIQIVLDQFNLIFDKKIEINKEKEKKWKFIGNNNSNSQIKNDKKIEDWIKFIGKNNFENYKEEYIKSFHAYKKFNFFSKDSDSFNFLSKNRSLSSDDKIIIPDNYIIQDQVSKNKIRDQIKCFYIKNK